MLAVAEKGEVCQELRLEVQEDGFLFIDLKRTEADNVMLTIQRTFENAIRSIAQSGFLSQGITRNPVLLVAEVFLQSSNFAWL